MTAREDVINGNGLGLRLTRRGSLLVADQIDIVGSSRIKTV